MTLPVLDAAAAKPKQSSHPPRDLHRVGDHWTAYNPPDPTTYPAGANTYTVKAGDTLWGIATQFFKNGYLWPQVWESNTWITDAHWIYPGDVLLIEGEAAQAAAQQAATGQPMVGSATQLSGGPAEATPATVSNAPQITAGVLISAADAVGGTAGPVALGTDADVFCYGYIGDPREPMPNTIHSYEDIEVRYEPGAVRQDLRGSTGDLVYLNGGSATGLVAGETYIIVEPEDMVVDRPGSTNVIGRHYQYIGQLKVLCADDTRARGIITQACTDIPVGARLRPLPQLPIPLARIPSLPAWCDPASGKTTGRIVHAQGGAWLSALGEGQLVQINLGQNDQLQPGDFLTVFRDSPVPGQGRQVLGEIGILTTEAHTATAKIVLMRYSMQIGDYVEVR
jgi:nucleoid-associated protein YgaU